MWVRLRDLHTPPRDITSRGTSFIHKIIIKKQGVDLEIIQTNTQVGSSAHADELPCVVDLIEIVDLIDALGILAQLGAME